MSEQQTYSYATYLDVRFPALSLVDVRSLVDACTDRWYNQTLCKVNDSVVRLGVMQGEYHWHKHDNDDEFFFVLDGHFIIDLEDQSIDLQPQQGYVVPKGVVHRTRAPERAVILMSKRRQSSLPDMRKTSSAGRLMHTFKVSPWLLCKEFRYERQHAITRSSRRHDR